MLPSKIPLYQKCVLQAVMPSGYASSSFELNIPRPVWQDIVRFGKYHRVLTQVARFAQMSDNCPEGIRAHLRAILKTADILQQIQVGLLRGIIDSLRNAKVMPVLLKGLGVAERFFEMPTNYVSKDIDILVRKADFVIAENVLQELGFVSENHDYFRRMHYHTVWKKDIPPFRPIEIELHHDLTLPGSFVRFEPSTWWERAEEIRMRSGTVLVPPKGPEIAYLAWHCLSLGRPDLRSIGAFVRAYSSSLGRLSHKDIEKHAIKARANPYLNRALQIAENLGLLEMKGALETSERQLFKRGFANAFAAPSYTLNYGPRSPMWLFNEFSYLELLAPTKLCLTWQVWQLARRFWVNNYKRNYVLRLLAGAKVVIGALIVVCLVLLLGEKTSRAVDIISRLKRHISKIRRPNS